MVIDTSALIAILEDEPEASQFSEAIAQARLRLLSAVSLVETSIVIENRRGAAGKHALDVLLEKAEIEIMNVTAEQAEIARQAYRTYGKGQGHPAQLNFGDCFAYALAKILEQPLLFKGEDFNKTDIYCYDRVKNIK